MLHARNITRNVAKRGVFNFFCKFATQFFVARQVAIKVLRAILSATCLATALVNVPLQIAVKILPSLTAPFESRKVFFNNSRCSRYEG